MNIPLPSLTGGSSGGAAAGDPYNITYVYGSGLRLPSWPQMLVVGLLVGSIYLGVKFIKR